jgi:hypothetical protein
MIAKLVRSIKGSSGRSVPREGVKLYSMDHGIDASRMYNSHSGLIQTQTKNNRKKGSDRKYNWPVRIEKKTAITNSNENTEYMMLRFRISALPAFKKKRCQYSKCQCSEKGN